jgi:hypothetical protein
MYYTVGVQTWKVAFGHICHYIYTRTINQIEGCPLDRNLHNQVQNVHLAGNLDPFLENRLMVSDRAGLK